MKLLSLLGLAALSSVVACASAAPPEASTEGLLQSPDGDLIDTALVATDTPVTEDACPMIPGTSRSGNDGAWVRGVARFDPSRFQAGQKPVLRVILRHGFVLVRGEEKLGGRLHGWVNVPIEDPTSGVQPFAIDMADNHTMWSEGNGTFHLVLIIDENGDNDLDVVTTQAEAMAASMPAPTELAKRTDVDISCHAPSPCLDVKVDCTGTSCLEITPVTSCTKKLPACESDADFCH